MSLLVDQRGLITEDYIQTIHESWRCVPLKNRRGLSDHDVYYSTSHTDPDPQNQINDCF